MVCHFAKSECTLPFRDGPKLYGCDAPGEKERNKQMFAFLDVLAPFFFMSPCAKINAPFCCRFIFTKSSTRHWPSLYPAMSAILSNCRAIAPALRTTQIRQKNTNFAAHPIQPFRTNVHLRNGTAIHSLGGTFFGCVCGW